MSVLIRKSMVFLRSFLKGKSGRYSPTRLVVITFGPTMGASYVSSLIYFMILKDVQNIISLVNSGFIFLGSAMGIVAAFNNKNPDNNAKSSVIPITSSNN